MYLCIPRDISKGFCGQSRKFRENLDEKTQISDFFHELVQNIPIYRIRTIQSQRVPEVGRGLAGTTRPWLPAFYSASKTLKPKPHTHVFPSHMVVIVYEVPVFVGLCVSGQNANPINFSNRIIGFGEFPCLNMFSCRHRGETARQDFIFLSPATGDMSRLYFFFLLANLANRVPTKTYVSRQVGGQFIFISPIWRNFATNECTGPIMSGCEFQARGLATGRLRW